MYINLKLALKKGYLPKDIVQLQMIKQNGYEDLSKEIEDYILPNDMEKYSDEGLLAPINAKKKSQPFSERVRLSKKAKDLLENLETPLVSEETLLIFDWVKNVYSKNSKEIGNSKKCKMYIELFSKESGIVKNALCFLIQTFLSDDKEFEFSQRAEYLFYKGASVFNVRFDLHQSRLYQYFQKREEYFLKEFEKYQ